MEIGSWGVPSFFYAVFLDLMLCFVKQFDGIDSGYCRIHSQKMSCKNLIFHIKIIIC